MDQNHPQNPQRDTLGTQNGPPKVIFGNFIDFGHFPIEIPIEAEKTTTMGTKGLRAKNKNSSEICEQKRSTWEHAQFKMSNFSQ